MDDWHSQPYVDITIVPISEGGCPAEYEPLFSLMWDGTKDLCITRAPEKAETQAFAGLSRLLQDDLEDSEDE